MTLQINTQGTGEIRFTKSRLNYRTWKYRGVPWKIFNGVPRGPQKRQARSICYICYIANPAQYKLTPLPDSWELCAYNVDAALLL